MLRYRYLIYDTTHSSIYKQPTYKRLDYDSYSQYKMPARLVSHYYYHLTGERCLLLDVIACFLLISSLDVSSSLVMKDHGGSSIQHSISNGTTTTAAASNSTTQSLYKISSKDNDSNLQARYPPLEEEVPLGHETPTTWQFVRAPHALQDHPPIRFRDEWLNDFNVAPPDISNSNSSYPMPAPPQVLPVPDFVDVFELTRSSSPPTAHASNTSNNNDTARNTILKTLGHQARQLIDHYLEQGSGAMLFRRLDQQIHNPNDFATFWSHVLNDNHDNNNTTTTTTGWNPMEDHLSCYNRKRQRLAAGGGVDRVDTDVPGLTIGPHNEHSCNPYPSRRIMFYALHTAAHGGETLLRRNRDIDVPVEAWEIVLHHRAGGGIHFERSYPHARRFRVHDDKNNHTTTQQQSQPSRRHPTEMSWQERCQTNKEDVARAYFQTHHGIANVTFDQNDGTLTARNWLPGYLWEDGDDEQEPFQSTGAPNSNHQQQQPLWFNRIDYGFPVALADGTTFPQDLQAYLKRQKWHETYSFRLDPGDWLVLDNRRVQHGRLPYEDSQAPGVPPRQLLVTYTT